MTLLRHNRAFLWIARALRSLRRLGIRRAAERGLLAARTWRREWQLGIRTERWAPRRGSSGLRSTPRPTGYRTLDAAFDGLEIGARDVALAYGAGAGRTVIYAAQKPFARVLGVESSADLVRQAETNLRRARRLTRRLRCADVRFVQSRAEEHVPADDVTLILLFHPFVGPTLDAIVRQIDASYWSAPRALTVLHAAPRGSVSPFDQLPWLACVTTELVEGVRLKGFRSQPLEGGLL